MDILFWHVAMDSMEKDVKQLWVILWNYENTHKNHTSDFNNDDDDDDTVI